MLSYWIPRLHFGAWLLVFGELVAWQNAANYTLQDWLALAVIYIALAALSFDLLARMNVDDYQSLLLVAGIFGAVRALMVSQIDIDNFAIDLIFLPMGVQVMMFLLAFYSFRTGRIPYYVYIVAAILGFCWGTWTRWSPELESVNISAPNWDESLPYVIIGLLLAELFPLILHPPHKIETDDWLLTPYEWAAVGGVIFVTVLLRGNQGYIDTLSFGIIVLVLVMLGFMLYFTRGIRRRTWLRQPHQTPIIQWLPALIPFALCAWAAYNLTDGDDTPLQATLLFRGLLIFGLAWLPIVSIAMGLRILRQSLREGY